MTATKTQVGAKDQAGAQMFAPNGTIAATNTQDAIEEVATEAASKADLASTANGKGASLIGIEDSGALITATTVEGALAELATTVREVLTASRTYYVSSTGSDSNDGLSAGAPFATLQKAVNTVWHTIDTNGHDVTISVAAGTYTAGVYIEGPLVGEGRVSIIGDQTTPSNVVVSVSGAAAFTAYTGAFFIVKGVKITGATRSLYAAWGGTIWFDHIDFGTATNYHMRASSGYIWLIGDMEYTISGGAPYHWSAHTCGVIYVNNGSVTLTGTPAFSYFAQVATGGSIECISMTFTGSATGSRYYCEFGGTIKTDSALAETFLPGSGNGAILPGGISPGYSANLTSVYSAWRTFPIADDAAGVLDWDAYTGGIGLIKIHSLSGAKTAVPVGEIRVRSGAAPYIENVSLDLTGVVLTTGLLTGTTGADGKFTIAPHTDGNIYFENRTGATRFLTLMFML